MFWVLNHYIKNFYFAVDDIPKHFVNPYVEYKNKVYIIVFCICLSYTRINPNIQ
jgi:hypothetical protein